MAESYIIHISKGTNDEDVVLEDTMSDTTYIMSLDLFESIRDGNYFWAVAPLPFLKELNWSTFRKFVVDKINGLDTTYFPFSVGYEWTYEALYTVTDGSFSGILKWEYDTVRFRVTDSISSPGGFTFVLNRGFYDVGDSVSVVKDSVDVFDNLFQGLGRMIALVPDTTEKYRGDTLMLNFYFEWQLPNEWDYETWEVARLKGIGVLYQTYFRSKRQSGYVTNTSASYGLLSFCKGDRIVWERD